MNNNNWNAFVKAEEKKGVNFKIVNGKIHVKVGNKYTIRELPTPVRKYTLNQLNILGPSTRIYNNARFKSAMKVYHNAIQKQINALEMLKMINKPAYNKAIKKLLGPGYVGYVHDKLKTVGKLGFKNYSVYAKNKSLRGFAVFHNSRTNNNTRILNLIVTLPKEGVGKILMNRILNNAKKNHKTIVRLNSVPSAINFYKKIGFKPIGNESGAIIPMMKKF